jgi:homocysteine S-methyltransferase
MYHQIANFGRLGASLRSFSTASDPLRPFAPFLASPLKVVVLDGGLTTSLPNGAEKHHLWGHQLLYGVDGGLPELKQVHRNFLESGADCIGSLTYKLSHEMISQCDEKGMLPAESHVSVEDLFHRAIGTAKEARDEFWAANENTNRIKPLVFASCGSFDDSTKLFVGQTDPNTKTASNQRGDMLRAEIKLYYERKLRSIAMCDPDGVAIETLPSLEEAVIAAEALETVNAEIGDGSPLPGWISFICMDSTQTNSGDSFGECIQELGSWTKYPHTIALGINCVNPAWAETLLTTAKGVLKTHDGQEEKILAIYPNTGTSRHTLPFVDHMILSPQAKCGMHEKGTAAGEKQMI